MTETTSNPETVIDDKNRIGLNVIAGLVEILTTDKYMIATTNKTEIGNAVLLEGDKRSYYILEADPAMVKEYRCTNTKTTLDFSIIKKNPTT